MPGRMLGGGGGLLQVPLWNSVFFKQEVKSRVQENKFRTFYSPSLAAKGMQRVADCVTESGQLDTNIIPLVPPSYREG